MIMNAKPQAAPRKRTIYLTLMRAESRPRDIDTAYPKGVERPVTRADCKDGPRPCPFVSCRHHLYLDVSIAGNIRINYMVREPWELRESCALDVADRGEHTLEEVGELLEVVRERVRQIESTALRRLNKNNRATLQPFMQAEDGV